MGKNKHSKKHQSPKTPRFITHPLFNLPFILISLIYPFLVQYNSVQNPLLDIPSYYQTEYLSDTFLLIKARFLIFIVISILCIFSWHIAKNIHTCRPNIQEYMQFLPLLIYAIFAILSTIFAYNTTLSLNGLPGLFENIWVLLSYLILCIFGFWYTKTVEKKSSLIYFFLGGTLMMGIVFLLQFLGMDPFLSLLEEHNAQLAVEGIYGGFYNPNYLGSYAVLVLPLLTVLLVVYRNSKKISILFGITIVLTLLGLVGSKSTGGIIGLAAVLGFSFLFFIFKKLNLSSNKFFITISMLIVAVVVAAACFINHAGKTGQFLYQPLESFYTYDNYLSVHYNGKAYNLNVAYTDADFQVTCTSENGNVLEPTKENDNYIYPYFAVKPYTLLEAEGMKIFGVTCDTNTWFFTNDTQDGTYYYLTTNGDLAKNTSEAIWKLPIMHKDMDAIYTYDDYLEIHYGNEIFYLNTTHTDTTFQVNCVNEDKEMIASTFENNTFVYPFFTIAPCLLANQNNIIGFVLTYGSNHWCFTNDTPDGSYYAVTVSGGFDKITAENTPTGVLLFESPRFMTGRGYIWSHAFSMLSDTLFVGYGPDNFAVHFPNHDFIGALQAGFSNTYISKPHNLYLQIATQTGLPSLLAFLVFYLIYFVKSVKLYFATTQNAKHSLIGLGIFLGTIGYLIVGLVNDSSITVAPFFWLLIGMGYAMNQICIKEQS